jgi:hypothetical protein
MLNDDQGLNMHDGRWMGGWRMEDGMGWMDDEWDET